MGKAVYISGPGLYQLIFFNRLEAADRFRYWVTKVLMPGLRELKERTPQVVKSKSFGCGNFPDNIQGKTNEPYFNGKDVCALLGYTNSKKTLQEHLDKDEKKSLLEMGPISGPTYKEGKPFYRWSC